MSSEVRPIPAASIGAWDYEADVVIAGFGIAGAAAAVEAASAGAEVLVRFEDLHIACRVRDSKMAYGRPRLLVEPLAGVGQQWIELSRLVHNTGIEMQEVL